MQANSIFRQESELAQVNVYVGERDAYGRRHGKGKFTFADGSYYDGEWHEGLRQGVGYFKQAASGTQKSSVFKGQWINDLKHGHGRIQDEDGNTIIGIWQHDKKNGLCRVKRFEEDDWQEVVYKDDMQVQVGNSGLSGWDSFYIVMSVIFMVCFYLGLAYGVLLQDENFFAQSAFAAILYLLWSWSTPATSYIWNTYHINRVFANIDAAIRAAPTCKHRIECFHYETHVFHEEDEQGRRVERTERTKVVTHTATEDFQFSLCIDRSPPSSTLNYLDVFHLVRLKTAKNISYTPAAWSRYLWEKSDFIARNRRDEQYEYHFNQDIPYQAEYVLVYNDARGGKPYFVNFFLLILLDFFMVGWTLRLTLL